MKKLISVLLAVSALALSTSAFAATPGTVSNRNSDATGFTSATAGNVPCFRTGDSVNFELNGVTGTITLISYKDGATAVDNTSIQYINQYTKDSNDKVTVTYKIRSGLANGTYNLLIKDGDATVVTYKYKVANPVANMAKLSEDNAEDYVAKNGNDYTYAAVASVEGATFTESGVKEVGFHFETADKEADSAVISATTLDSKIGAEVSGQVNVVYAVTISGVAEGTTITPNAVMTDK